MVSYAPPRATSPKMTKADREALATTSCEASGAHRATTTRQVRRAEAATPSRANPAPDRSARGRGVRGRRPRALRPEQAPTVEADPSGDEQARRASACQARTRPGPHP